MPIKAVKTNMTIKIKEAVFFKIITLLIRLSIFQYITIYVFCEE